MTKILPYITILALACVCLTMPQQKTHADDLILPDDTLWLIGTPDGSGRGFGCAEAGYPNFLKEFPDGRVDYEVGRSDPHQWPFLHPAQRDTFAGGEAFTFNIRFKMGTPEIETYLKQPAVSNEEIKFYLVIGIFDAHPAERSDIHVTANGAGLPVQLAPPGNGNAVFRPTGRGEVQTIYFDIPANHLKAGENTITIRLEKESWILYDYLALRIVREPMDAPPPRDLLKAFTSRPDPGETAPPMQDVEEIVFAMRPIAKDSHWYANFAYYAASDPSRHNFDRECRTKNFVYLPGGKLCVKNIKTGDVRYLIDDPQGNVRDPAVHYDAKKIIFSYRRGDSENYHLYEINTDGTGLKQLTDGPYDDIEPCYLPNGDIIFVSTRCRRWVNCWLTQVANLHRCGPSGENIRTVTSNTEQDNTPWVLPDGQILFMRWEYVDRSQVHYHHLWTISPDGTRQMVYYGNLRPGVVMIDAKPIRDSRKIVVNFSHGHGDREHAGQVALLDPRGGPDNPKTVQYISTHNRCHDPWAFSERAFMAGVGPMVVLMDEMGNEFPIYTATEDEQKAGLTCHEPRPIIPHPRERVLPDVDAAGSQTGKLLLADVYTGRNMTGIKPGEIKKLLVMEVLPKPINYTGGMEPTSYGGTFTLERVVGTVPVEEDGSAYLELPAYRSFFFVAMDENDMSIKRMQSFLNVVPGEVTACVGCHEQRTLTPLAQFNIHQNVKAMRREASKIVPIPNIPDVISYPRDVQPVLDKHCVACHDYDAHALADGTKGGPRAGGVIFTGDHSPMYSISYYTITAKTLVADGRNRAVSNYAPRTLGSSASRLLTFMDGSHYGAKPSPDEFNMVRYWIESGAPYIGTYAGLGSGQVGGYYMNRLDRQDLQWQSTKAARDVFARRCDECHTGQRSLPKSVSDENGEPPWVNLKPDDNRRTYSRQLLYNLSRPEKSLILLAPLAKDAGGLELCPEVTFRSTDDADYQALLEMVRDGQRFLEKIKRFDMPGFLPRVEYLHEMKRYGVLPADTPEDKPIDCYELDQAYWRSLWKPTP